MTNRRSTDSGPSASFESLMTPSEVAALFRVDPKTVTRWASAGKLTSFRTLGGHRRYRAAEVHALLDGAQQGHDGHVRSADGHAGPDGHTTLDGHAGLDGHAALDGHAGPDGHAALDGTVSLDGHAIRERDGSGPGGSPTTR